MQLNREPGLLNGVNCQVHETLRHRWKVGLDFHERGHLDDFEVPFSFAKPYSSVSWKRRVNSWPSAQQSRGDWFHGGRAWWLSRALTICLSWLIYGGLELLSPPQKIWKLDPFGMHWGHETLADSLPPSIPPRLRYLIDRRHSPHHIVHLIEMKTLEGRGENAIQRGDGYVGPCSLRPRWHCDCTHLHSRGHLSIASRPVLPYSDLLSQPAPWTPTPVMVFFAHSTWKDFTDQIWSSSTPGYCFSACAVRGSSR